LISVPLRCRSFQLTVNFQQLFQQHRSRSQFGRWENNTNVTLRDDNSVAFFY
jgi:hypothetical protein